MQGRDADVARGRQACANAAWLDASAHLSQADEVASLEPADLELLATASYMLGNDGVYGTCLERAHKAHLAAGNIRRAVRCAFCIGHNRLFRGDPVRASGWFARAQRMLGDQECVEAGYLLIPAWLMAMAHGDFERGHITAMRAEAVGSGSAISTWPGSRVTGLGGGGNRQHPDTTGLGGR